MNTTTRISTAERLGRTAGRGWRAYARGERRVSHWLTSNGMPVSGASAFVWAVKLVLLGTLFYIAFWLALLFILAVAAGWAMRQNDYDEDSSLQFPTTIEELRETPGYDPNLYNDTSHEMYEDND